MKKSTISKNTDTSKTVDHCGTEFTEYYLVCKSENFYNDSDGDVFMWDKSFKDRRKLGNATNKKQFVEIIDNLYNG